MPTPNEEFVTDEQKKDDARFQELNKKPEAERTAEEKTELVELKDKYGKRVQSKIDKLTWESKSAKEEAERLRQELEEEKKKREELETKAPPTRGTITQEFIEVNGKKYYTDEALQEMINAKEISEADAIKYQQKRNKEEIKFEVRQDLEKEEKVKTERELRMQDSKKILEKHPEWDKNNPNHNPNDPLFKLANELWNESYKYLPDGLTKAEKRAREILRISDTPLDRSDDLNMDEGEGTPKNRSKNGEKEVTLTEAEKETAIRIYTIGGLVNPKTGKPYTDKEAEVKALEAKKRRMGK